MYVKYVSEWNLTRFSLLLFSQQYKEYKSFCEDLTEEKFSFPIIHAIRSDSESTRILSILSENLSFSSPS